ncbi:DUF6668 family protein [Micromonospora sp. DT81.3]|uniref:DUF6668 family protein n=1 Tax=Micromonospora sp. DT81.3 TaxID=3416523 RepID=UPI003CF76C12
MTNANPWLTGSGRPAKSAAEPPSRPFRRTGQEGANAPQPGVPVPDTADRLPRWTQAWPASVYWLGVHGGAGESTLATLAAGSRPASHGWPIPDMQGSSHRVVLVARTNFMGLTAAQRAATEWASGALGDGVQLGGLVLMADAPGRRPKPLRDFEQVIGGGVPRVWTMPWVEAWRLGPVSPTSGVPREFVALLTDLQLDFNTHARN